MGEEYPHSDQIQVVMLLMFTSVWALDSFLLKSSTHLALFVPLPLRLLIAGFSVALGLIFIDRSHKLVIEGTYDKPTLIDTSVYSLVRHPMYLGILLLYFGFFSSTVSIVSLGLWIGIFIIYDKMAAYEEQDLFRIFGEDYIDYKHRVPRWIPRKFSTKTRKVDPTIA